MGIDYDGGMIIGEIGSKLCEPDTYDGFGEWVEDNDMKAMSLHYDAGSDFQNIGFAVPDIAIAEMDGEWLADVKAKARKFEEITGVPAKLIGTQNIG
jgi:hypothetical protein